MISSIFTRAYLPEAAFYDARSKETDLCVAELAYRHTVSRLGTPSAEFALFAVTLLSPKSTSFRGHWRQRR